MTEEPERLQADGDSGCTCKMPNDHHSTDCAKFDAEPPVEGEGEERYLDPPWTEERMPDEEPTIEEEPMTGRKVSTLSEKEKTEALKNVGAELAKLERKHGEVIVRWVMNRLHERAKLQKEKAQLERRLAEIG